MYAPAMAANFVTSTPQRGKNKKRRSAADQPRTVEEAARAGVSPARMSKKGIGTFPVDLPPLCALDLIQMPEGEDDDSGNTNCGTAPLTRQRACRDVRQSSAPILGARVCRCNAVPLTATLAEAMEAALRRPSPHPCPPPPPPPPPRSRLRPLGLPRHWIVQMHGPGLLKPPLPWLQPPQRLPLPPPFWQSMWTSYNEYMVDRTYEERVEALGPAPRLLWDGLCGPAAAPCNEPVPQAMSCRADARRPACTIGTIYKTIVLVLLFVAVLLKTGGGEHRSGLLEEQGRVQAINLALAARLPLVPTPGVCLPQPYPPPKPRRQRAQERATCVCKEAGKRCNCRGRVLPAAEYPRQRCSWTRNRDRRVCPRHRPKVQEAPARRVYK